MKSLQIIKPKTIFLISNRNIIKKCQNNNKVIIIEEKLENSLNVIT